MSRQRDNRVVSYVDDATLDRLVETSEEVGKSQSELIRDALREFLDRDHQDRVEERLRRIEEKLDDHDAHLRSETTHTHTESNDLMLDESERQFNSESAETVHTIADHLVSECWPAKGAPVKNRDVEQAIKDIAGIDPRTIRKYKRELQSRGLLFEHPLDTHDIWTPEPDVFRNWLNTATREKGYTAIQNIDDEKPFDFSEGLDGKTTLDWRKDNFDTVPWRDEDLQVSVPVHADSASQEVATDGGDDA
jgi:hypothetical protein